MQLVAVEHVQTERIGGDPYAVPLIFEQDAGHERLEPAQCGGHLRQATVLNDVDADVAANPDAAEMIFADRLDGVAAETFGTAESREPTVLQAIRATPLRTEPQCARTILQYGAHAYVLQADLGRVVLEFTVLEPAES